MLENGHLEGNAIFVILAPTSASIVEYHEADDEGDESGLQVTIRYFCREG